MLCTCIQVYWGIKLHQSLWKEKITGAKTSWTICSLKDLVERKTTLPSPDQQVQWGSAEEEKQWREKFKSFKTRTSSLKYQPMYSLSWQESRSVSCAEEIDSEKRTRELYGKYFPKEWREETPVNGLLK